MLRSIAARAIFFRAMRARERDGLFDIVRMPQAMLVLILRSAAYANSSTRARVSKDVDEPVGVRPHAKSADPSTTEPRCDASPRSRFGHLQNFRTAPQALSPLTWRKSGHIGPLVDAAGHPRFRL